MAAGVLPSLPLAPPWGKDTHPGISASIDSPGPSVADGEEGGFHCCLSLQSQHTISKAAQGDAGPSHGLWWR